MCSPIVQTSETVVLVGGGDVNPGDLDAAFGAGGPVVAADGGLRAVLAAGRMPDAVVGDFDSAPPEMLERVPPDRVHRIAEQQSTDFDKALRNIDSPLVLAVGFLGARLDHQLAAFHAMLVHRDRPCVLIGAQECVLLAPPRIALDLAPGEVVSLFPLVPVTGRSGGLAWPIDGIDFAPALAVGTSNRATGPVTLEFDGPGMLLILPRRALDIVIAALRRQSPAPARWTARA